MSTPPHPPGGTSTGPTQDDPTRDVRRPSSTDRLPSAATRTGTGQPTVTSPPRGSAPPEDRTIRLEQPESLPSRPDALSERVTDKISSPSPVRQQTLAFGAPDLRSRAGGTQDPGALGRPAGQPPAVAPQPARMPTGSAPAPPGPGGPFPGTPRHEAGPGPDRERRWPWVVLTLLPILVIAIAAVLLFLLLAGG